MLTALTALRFMTLPVLVDTASITNPPTGEVKGWDKTIALFWEDLKAKGVRPSLDWVAAFGPSSGCSWSTGRDGLLLSVYRGSPLKGDGWVSFYGTPVACPAPRGQNREVAHQVEFRTRGKGPFGGFPNWEGFHITT